MNEVQYLMDQARREVVDLKVENARLVRLVKSYARKQASLELKVTKLQGAVAKLERDHAWGQWSS